MDLEYIIELLPSLIVISIFAAVFIIPWAINRRTDRKGEECIGKVLRVYADGTDSEGEFLYKVEFLMYVASQDKVMKFSEKIGYSEDAFSIGDYYVLKYCKGDINIFCKIEKDMVPLNVLDKLDGESENLTNDIYKF